MKKIWLFFILFSGFLLVSAPSVQAGEIVLKDGTIIKGKISAFSNGVYTIVSDSLGTVQISESKIREIRLHSPPTSGDPGQKGIEKGVQGLQNSMLSNEEIRNLIRSLQNDPEVQKILNDPEVMEAVLAGDANSLMSNPKFMNLFHHPKIKQLMEKMKK